MAWASRVLGEGHRVLMAAATSTAVAVRTRGRPAGILKVVPVSPSLGEFLKIGVSEVSRTDAVKKVWEYIKYNNLQNPSNKEIVCDDKLKTIFSGKDRVMFLEIAKLMSQHFSSLADCGSEMIVS
ncbi:upstream activation factor subunit UAF30-like [Bidens hawaiensis]|uniref:upstream activation factor subunit UAF30-like n=1 Tax=Bidens hawaiensis TaxID=980011 RepID=UPI00404B0F5B